MERKNALPVRYKLYRRIVNAGVEIAALFSVYVLLKISDDSPLFWPLLISGGVVGFSLSELWSEYLEKITDK